RRADALCSCAAWALRWHDASEILNRVLYNREISVQGRLTRVAVGQKTKRITDTEHRRQLRRAVLASTVGTAIEWYDFFLYSTVTGLVFARLYFPRADPLVGTLEAFGVYAIGFLARPIGAAIFGHFGDRLGRKAALV